MINQGKPSTPSGSPAKSQTKATDHELQKHDIFTRYGQGARSTSDFPSEVSTTNLNGIPTA
ncbi:hypothetical protein ACVILK_006563 [Bradyrhizobium embrapense]